MKKVLEGSQAVAEAVRLTKVQVISAYPITPQTHIVEILSDYVTTGKMNAKFLRVESEHSCLAAFDRGPEFRCQDLYRHLFPGTGPDA